MLHFIVPKFAHVCLTSSGAVAVAGGEKKELNVTRIAVHSLGSPSWASSDQADAVPLSLALIDRLQEGDVLGLTLTSHASGSASLDTILPCAQGVASLFARRVRDHGTLHAPQTQRTSPC
jgi:hypothetical protein